MDWHQDVFDQLCQRDKREAEIFSSIVEDYRNLFLDYNNEKRKQVIQSTMNEPSNKEFQELEEKYNQLKEEVTELYKSQSQNTQKLLFSNEHIRTLESHVADRDKEIKRISKEFEAFKLSKLAQEKLLEEKDVTIQVLQDELTALQLELLKVEERYNILECENKTLVDRWLEKMNQEAAALNLVNEEEIGEKSPELLVQPSICKLPKSVSIKTKAHKTELNMIKISRDSSLIASASSDKKIGLLDAESFSVTTKLSGSVKGLLCLDISSNLEMLAAGSLDYSLLVWNLFNRRVKHTLTGHSGKVSSCVFNIDSTRLFSSSHDRTFKIWDIDRGYCLKTMFSVSICNDLVIGNSTGQTLFSGHLDNGIRLWDQRSGSAIKEITDIHSGQVTSLDVSFDSHEILSCSRDNTIKLLDMRTFETLTTFSSESFRTSSNQVRACLSPDGRFVSSGSADGTVLVWNKQSGKVELKNRTHSSPIVFAGWSASGKTFVSADRESNICRWE